MKKLMGMIAVLAMGVAQAATIDLPDSSIPVEVTGNTITVTVDGVTYRGAGNFVYVSECQRPDASGYHCDIKQADNAKLSAPGHDPIYATVTVQFAGILIRSGHNYWRNTEVVLDGNLTI